ncbi:MAG: hypothetical protein EXS25_09095 [Pedosphaera sp.]|nr:hypothetical protein [Pedosphaera sp.]
MSFFYRTRVYLAAGQTDFRKSFDTLAGVVRGSLHLDPLLGHLFVFGNQKVVLGPFLWRLRLSFINPANHPEGTGMNLESEFNVPIGRRLS